MQRIFAIGETVLDIIFKDLQVKDAKPGGSMLNTSVSLGRAGLEVFFISEYANDEVGEMVNSFLHDNGVNTRYVYKHTSGKTSIAMAMLNAKNDASYVFYKDHPGERLDSDIPEFREGDMLIFGSFFGIDPALRYPVFNLVNQAKQNGALVIYDPNFRKSHLDQLDQLHHFIIENIAVADIVRGSDEDFINIFQTDNPEEIRNIIGTEISVLLLTQSSKQVYLNTVKHTTSLPVKRIDPVSTIGAGDNFNAGIIYGLIKNKVTKANLNNITHSQWKKILYYGIDFASDVCMSYENYISKDFVKQRL
jgi:fructokinase